MCSVCATRPKPTDARIGLVWPVKAHNEQLIALSSPLLLLLLLLQINGDFVTRVLPPCTNARVSHKEFTRQLDYGEKQLLLTIAARRLTLPG